MEWDPGGIRTVAIAPGPFPNGRLGRLEELTDLTAYLLSPHAAHIGGEMIAIDGGAHLRSSSAEDLLRRSQARWDALQRERPAKR